MNHDAVVGVGDPAQVGALVEEVLEGRVAQPSKGDVFAHDALVLSLLLINININDTR